MSADRFLSYGRQTIEPDDVRAVADALRGDFLTTGPTVDRFEEALAAGVGARGAVAVSSGTAALHAACFAAGIKAGDEVIVPALTFLATANCVRYLGADPVFADVDPDTGLVLPEEVERRLGPRTRAVVPVHLNGTAADMGAIRRTAERAGLAIVEDAAHALGGRHLDPESASAGPAIGSCGGGSLATFSFHPVKSITTGEGGAVTADDPDLLRRMRMFRNHGIVREDRRLQSPAPGPWYYEQQILGHNLRLSDIQAALGLSQLGKLERFIGRRRSLASRYDSLLDGVSHVSPVVRAESRRASAYHLYPVLIDFAALGLSRATLMTRLRERGIGTQVHYIPLPLQPYYRERGCRLEEFPGAARYYERVLSLPLFPTMDDTDVDRVVTTLAELLDGDRGGTR